MSKVRLATTLGIVSATAILVVSLPVSQTRADQCTDHCNSSKKQITCSDNPNEDVKKTVNYRSCERQPTQVSIPNSENKLNRSDTSGLEEICSVNIPKAILSLDKAVRAAESDDKTATVVELLNVRKILISTNDALGEHMKPHFVNSHCPIMGSPIDVSKVAENLMRDYKGRKIAFCCAECPIVWDSLTNAQKKFKLPSVKF